MRRLRQEASGIVRRKIPSVTLVKTLFGDEELSMQQCTACKTFKYKFEFYLESSSKRKYCDQTRKQCVECWDIFKGSNNTIRTNKGVTLEELFNA